MLMQMLHLKQKQSMNNALLSQMCHKVCSLFLIVKYSAWYENVDGNYEMCGDSGQSPNSFNHAVKRLVLLSVFIVARIDWPFVDF